MSGVVAVKVPKRLKEAMKSYSHLVDWPAEIRAFIEERIRRIEAEKSIKNVVKILEKTGSVEQGFAAEAVRSDRDSR